MQSMNGEEGDQGGTGPITPKVVMSTSLGAEGGIPTKRSTTSPTSTPKKARVEQGGCGNPPSPNNEESAEFAEQGHPPVDDSHKDASTLNDELTENNPWKMRRNPRFPAQTKTLRLYKNVPTLSTPETSLDVTTEKSQPNVLGCDDLIDQMHSIIDNVNVPTNEMREIAKLRDEVALSRHQMKAFMTAVVNMFEALNDRLGHVEADVAIMKEGN
ncbi:hypothetical protein THARTR1_03950 [Trichoderma harzianum]|uniref:Uncharacterized protein n=1 Tax=Trichoderma harzianum TaxID=5544 RepID=A0A2K0UE11_TRIHA|nr:hypothetical protein THARTR1_03950 [Trichoderma harzianum]